MALPVLSASYKYVAIFIMLVCFCAHHILGARLAVGLLRQRQLVTPGARL